MLSLRYVLGVRKVSSWPGKYDSEEKVDDWERNKRIIEKVSWRSRSKFPSARSIDDRVNEDNET